ncbi:MAG TPA: hypothetical protein VF412_11425 [Bdellovibrio sp.]|uniref:hypothetical protein n=1 Tax=Bdellovibrio sp. TaxID=28201 RepID=UPI002EDFB68C
MRRVILLIAIFNTFLAIQPAHAGKTEDIQAEVKKVCGKDISSNDALRLVKQLYLACTEGTKVEVEAGCSLNCMKSAGGKVIGQ